MKNGLIALTIRTPVGLQIATIQPDGNGLRQLNYGGGDDGRPAWSRDGKRIAYGTFVNGRSFVAVMDADGGNRKRIAIGNAPDWAPDGRIFFAGDDNQIHSINPDGSDQRRITTSASFKGPCSLSPDGKRMAVVILLNPGHMDYKPRIGLMTSDGRGERLLTMDDRTNVRKEADGSVTVLGTAFDANAPAWSPVCDEIIFWSGIENSYGQVWKMRADGTDQVQLTDAGNQSNNDDPSWSPDGTMILFGTNRRGRVELWGMNADGSDQHPVSDQLSAGPYPGRASWQPVL